MKLQNVFFRDSQIARCSGDLLTVTMLLLVVVAQSVGVSPNLFAQSVSDQDASLFEAAVRETDPLSPEQEQATFRLPEGFQISCFASEPELQKPMNMAFDADGRLWVTGSNEYPIPAKPGEGTDSIRILEDTNGDGSADSVQVFADNLNIPIGLLPYGNGAIVFSIPDILYLEDTDGDGRSDKQTKLYGPFDTTRDTHGMTNSFTAYHDGWIYACHGFNNQSTVAGTDGHAVTMHSGNTYRFRPDGSRIEIWTRGQVNPFGMTFDEVGDLFTSDCHSKPVNLLIRGGYHESFGKPHDGLGFIPNVMSHQHGSTAIDAVCWYDGDRFPEHMRGDLFLGNVMTGRVHRNRINRSGGTVAIQEQADFIVSNDPWFRPVDIQCGPDGALYIADFYNRIIGHYEVPLDDPGRDRRRARIWKVEYVGQDLVEGNTPPDAVRLSEMSPEQLVVQLNDHRLQLRVRAAELLSTIPGDAKADLVRDAWEQSQKNEDSKAAAHLLWILHRIDSLQPADILRAMNSNHRVLRIHAMKVCSERSLSDELAEQIRLGLRDADRLVQRAAADAAAQHPGIVLFKELVNALTVTPAQDVHLRHAVKIALRNQLQHDDVVDWFLRETQPQAAYNACAEVVRGLQTDRTAALVISILGHTKLNAGEVTSLIGHAAEDANSDSVTQLVRFAAAIPDVDSNQLTQIHQVLSKALASNSEADLTEFAAFEYRLLKQLLEETDVEDLYWGRYHWDDRPAGTWGHEDRTKSNSSTSRFLSSLSGGETAVSVLRSRSFVVPFRLELELCGHLGFPDQEALADNQLVLRESQSGAILRSARPPRNDRAMRVAWKLADAVGKRSVLELQDGIDLGAYAWLAIGPITPSVASPLREQRSDLQQRLLTIVRILDGRSTNGMLQTEHLQLLADVVVADQVNGETREQAAAVLFRQRGLDQMAPLSILLKYGRIPLTVHNRIASACSINEPWMGPVASAAEITSPPAELVFQQLPKADQDEDEARQQVPLLNRGDWIHEVVRNVFSELSEFYRIKLAREMASSGESAELLIEVMETGTPSASLLRDQTLLSMLMTQGTQIASAAERMVKQLPPEDPVPAEYVSAVLLQLKDQRTAPQEGTLEAGRILFERHCIVCHRRGAEGGIAGPQLDGIKTRGSERLLEDILYPHRNVDLAFRRSVVVLKSGKTLSGVYRPQDSPQSATVVTSDGQVQKVAVSEIEELTETQQSLMPAGFHKLLPVNEMAALLTWLSQ